jgi:hypothetical protein
MKFKLSTLLPKEHIDLMKMDVKEVAMEREFVIM